MPLQLSDKTIQTVERLKRDAGLESDDALVERALLVFEKQALLQRLKQKIEISVEQIARGETHEVNDEFWKKLDVEIDEAIREGRPINPDVMP